MLVDLEHERGNPRQLQALTASLGAATSADAARLLVRLRQWHRDGRAGVAGSTDAPLHPRTLALVAGWRGDPSRLMLALERARVIESRPSGVRFRPPAPNLGASSRGRSIASAGELWKASLGELASLVNRANFEAFLADTAGLYRADGWLTVGVPSSYALAALADRFRSAMEWALYVASGERLRVRLVHMPPTGPLVRIAPDGTP